MRARERGQWRDTGWCASVLALGIFPRRMADPAVEDARAGPGCSWLPGPLGTLHLRGRPWLAAGPPSGRLRQQRRRLPPVEVRLNRRQQVVEDAAALLGAGRYHRPDALAP